MYPLLLSLANIKMHVRNKTSIHGFLLLALLPIPEFLHECKSSRICSVLEAHLFHRCLDIIIQPLKDAVTLDSGRGKHRLEMTRGGGSLKVVFKGTRMLGASSATLSNSRLCKRFKDLYKEHTLESSARNLRNPEIKGELSRFKLEKSTGDIIALYKCRPGAQTKQCS